MKNLLEISQLNNQQIKELIALATELKKKSCNFDQNYSKFSMANLFYEPSTRTRVSFELAAKSLGMPVINLDLKSSSETKGEILLDTIKTLEAMGINILVIRHQKEGIAEFLSNNVKTIKIINGGDGKHAHPTQALLDMMTILEKKSDVKKLKIVIVGDIKHSRVANSLQSICSIMQVGELCLVTPEQWIPQAISFGNITTSLKQGIKNADVVIALRIQKERFLPEESLNIDSYCQNYRITNEIMQYAKSDAIIMHPGPVNRGIEIDSKVVDSDRSLILEQVKNGVFIRMAVLKRLLDN